MSVTILAVFFLLVIVVVAFFGSRLLSKQSVKPGEADQEKCSVCREKFGKSELVLREIGDYKLLYFCRECILKLYADMGIKN